MTGLRCHLLIGPPASGKTTLARALAPLLTGPGEPPAVVLSTDAIRAEVFGDAAVQGPWSAIEQLLHQRIREAVAAGRPVIVDATHARRPWRLALTQALPLPAPVEWVGWWLFTPLATCLEWNQQRQRLVPEPVIKELAAALADPHFGPSRAEGFAAVVAVVPTHHASLEPLLAEELARLDQRIRSATNRERQVQRHGYSRLLDLERLLHWQRFSAGLIIEAVPQGQGQGQAPPLGNCSSRRSARLSSQHLQLQQLGRLIEAMVKTGEGERQGELLLQAVGRSQLDTVVTPQCEGLGINPGLLDKGMGHIGDGKI